MSVTEIKYENGVVLINPAGETLGLKTKEANDMRSKEVTVLFDFGGNQIQILKSSFSPTEKPFIIFRPVELTLEAGEKFLQPARALYKITKILFTACPENEYHTFIALIKKYTVEP